MSFFNSFKSKTLYGFRNLDELHQNFPQRKDVENNFVNFCSHDRRLHCRRQVSIIYYMNFADTSPTVLLMVYSHLVMSILNMKNTRKYFFYSFEASVFWCFVSNLHVSGFSSCRII